MCPLKHSNSDYHTELDWFRRWATYAPNQIAVQFEDSEEKLTYAECFQRINQLAEHLVSEFKVKKGDRIAVLSLNSIDYLLLFFAVQKLGCILVPLNFRFTAAELAWPLKDASPALLLHEDEFTETVKKLEDDIPKIKIDSSDGFYAMAYKNANASEISHSGEFESPCMILYTSGTTGRPKGAVITNKMLFWNSVNTGLRLNLTQHDVTITFAPFFHTGGWNVLTTPFIHRGARLILSNKFEPEKVLQLCSNEKVTILFGVPTMMDMMRRTEAFENADLSSVRYAIVGGEPMPLNLIEDWHDKGIPIRQGYGLTEFGPNVFSLNEEDAIRKIGSIGFPNFYVNARMLDEQGNDVPENTPGELVLGGPAMMAGYWNNEKATKSTIVNGWLHTGDIVRRDSEGYFYVMDRKKDMYISGAENVYPAEVEQIIRKISGVREAAVIGVPDEKWGESGMAFIVVEDGKALTKETILEFCTGKLAKFKIPKHIRFIEELPKSDSGKILKRKLRDLI